MFDAMDTTGLDTLKATRTLEAAGFETPQAEALVAVVWRAGRRQCRHEGRYAGSPTRDEGSPGPN